MCLHEGRDLTWAGLSPFLLHRYKLRFREVKRLTKGHTTYKWQEAEGWGLVVLFQGARQGEWHKQGSEA